MLLKPLSLGFENNHHMMDTEAGQYEHLEPDTSTQDPKVEEEEKQGNAVNTIIDTWLNTATFITNIDMQKETYSTRSYFNLFWKVTDPESMSHIIPKLTAFKKENALRDTPWFDLLTVTDPETRKWVITALPVPWLYDLEWMFPNSRHGQLHLRMVHLFRMTDDIWYIEVLMEGTFEEKYELQHFPLDFQFLNLKIRFGRQFRFLSTVPNWINTLTVDPNWSHHEPINCTLLEPAKREWHLLTPWIDYRINHNLQCHLIRFRVVRKPRHYMLYNVVPLAIIIGLAFLSMESVMEDASDRMAYVLTLLLTIAAGRSELVPEMPQATAGTLLDNMVNAAYGIFAALMVGTAITEQIESADDTKVIEWVIWGSCLLVYVIVLIRFAVVWWMRRNDEVWRQRSREEFESWSPESDYDKFQKVDKDHFFATDFEHPINKGEFDIYSNE